MSGQAPDPGPLMAMATSYWGSQTLFAAVALGVFARLAQGPASIEQVAAATGTRPRPTGLLLKALAALGLVRRQGELFANTPVAAAFLAPGSPAYLGDALGYARDMYDAWGELERALREDAPVAACASYLGEDEARTRRFVHGMHARAVGVGQALVRMVDLTGRRRMLDLGGGPGTYSALFTQRYPQLRSQVLDLPAVVAIAGEILETMGASQRVSVIAGDYHDTEFPPDNDVVLISGVLHREREASARRLIARAGESLVPGGLLVVSDVFTDAGGSSPPFAALFGLNMLLSAPDGGVYADVDVAAWMDEAGLADANIQAFPPPMPHRLVTARRPEAA